MLKEVYGSLWKIRIKAKEHCLPYGITQHKWGCPTITLASQAGIQFSNPGEMEDWIDLVSVI